jgi:2,3-bisphosphoglycerate-independent phosphoglycerate mutase
MKTVLVIIDGLGDVPNPNLDFKTPLEVAITPHLDFMATNGKIGRINTVFDGFPIESMVCIMGLLGYEPEKFYPSGRASFEALARGIVLNPSDLVLRCNIISLDDSKKKISDFTAGLITDDDAKKIISQIKLPFDNWELYSGQSYRNLLVIRNANSDVKNIKCFEPHMNIWNNINDLYPYNKSNSNDIIMKNVQHFLFDTINQIKKMELPDTCKADMLWVWSPSIKPDWPSFKSRTGLTATFVGALDFLHGIAIAANINYEIIPGATGYIDTDYKAKGEYAKKELENNDLVLIHINATDEEAHQRNYVGKTKAIENIDRYIIGPTLDELEKKYKNNFRIAVCGDHETNSIDGKHGKSPVPYLVYGKGITPSPEHSIPFSEKNCKKFTPILSLNFLNEITNQ